MDYLQYFNMSYRFTIFKLLVLNLIINGLPSILKIGIELEWEFDNVLNLIINGLPSIHKSMGL